MASSLSSLGKRPASALSDYTDDSYARASPRPQHGWGNRSLMPPPPLPPARSRVSMSPSITSRESSLAPTLQGEGEYLGGPVPGGHAEEEQEEEKMNQYLALHAPGPGNLSAAYYDPETNKLLVLEDTKDTYRWDTAALLMEQFEPAVILLSGKAPDALVEVAAEYCQENPNTTYDLLTPSKFSHDMGLYHLGSVRLPRNARAVSESAYTWSDSGRGGPAPSTSDASEQEHEQGYVDQRDAGMGRIRLSLLKLGCHVNVDAPGAVCAAGALLEELAKVRGADPSGITPFELTAVESMNLEDHMLINQDALTSLAILSIDAGAKASKQQQSTTLSLNGVINTTVTPLGKKLFHTWLLRPLINIEQINRRLDAVEVLSSKECTKPRADIIKELRRIKDLNWVCRRIKSGKAGWKDWQSLVEGLTAAKDIIQQLTVLGFQAFHESLEITRKSKAALAIRKRVPQGLCEDFNVIYLPQLGCLVAAHGMLNPRLIPVDWEESFTTNNIWYFKTPDTDELNAEFGDIENNISDREIEWVQALAERLPDLEFDILGTADVLAELDCLLCLAGAVDKFDLTRPVMKEEPVLKIRKGFHLLHMMCVPDGPYIHNDTMIKGGSETGDVSSMMVVTGANGSGKSAYGKQVALITYMAHIGSFVPAAAAEIGICDKIFTRVQTRESASRTGSAFMIDLSQVSQALRGCTSRSLLILDEFGKGTISTDGAGLLAGGIEYLIQGPRPRTVVLTHYHELFTQQFLDDSLPIIYCHMKSIMAEGATTLTYLYNHLVSNFEITKLIDTELTAEDIAEIQAAESLAAKFIAWDLDAEDGDVLDTLADMLGGDEAQEEDAVATTVETDNAAERVAISTGASTAGDGRSMSVRPTSTRPPSTRPMSVTFA
ncbi:DNA mismatch repair protein MSH5 [Vanrija pseudolonga]|uniref:DNA mismatch repair protein MSH5 n=1 Tax=Vanrija pseudolonga TaxID=143232 RepID=A0AAF1BL05_9TREE|nr:DNA mismatch repair protein MSH5 [Vanrija pseudolonga]